MSNFIAVEFVGKAWTRNPPRKWTPENNRELRDRVLSLGEIGKPLSQISCRILGLASLVGRGDVWQFLCSELCFFYLAMLTDRFHPLLNFIYTGPIFNPSFVRKNPVTVPESLPLPSSLPFSSLLWFHFPPHLPLFYFGLLGLTSWHST